LVFINIFFIWITWKQDTLLGGGMKIEVCKDSVFVRFVYWVKFVNVKFR